MNKRRLLDCQYFKHIDTLIIHEILNGERNYIVEKNPKFHYYIEPELKDFKKDTMFYKLKKDLRKVECSFKDRFHSVCDELNVSVANPDEIENDYNFRKMLMANHNLYGADDSIEFRAIVDYHEKYKDEIDDNQEIKYLFFDIEVHSDFNKLANEELENIYNHIHFGKEYKPNLNKIYMEKFDYIMNETDMDKLAKYISNFSKDLNENNYVDMRFYLALMNSKALEIDEKRVKTFLSKNLTEEVMEFFNNNIGFPDEDKALNRIDAISFVDTKERKLYMYLLKVERDLADKDLEYISNEKLVKGELSSFIELFLLVSYLKNIDSSEKEICKELLDNLDFLNEKYKEIDIKNSEDVKKINYYINLAKEIIPNYDKKLKMDIEYEIFNNELTMIKKFFYKIKEEIKPNVIAAHNAKFDINTLKNRLNKFNEDFDKHINQLTLLNDKDLNRIKSYIKIDTTTLERKKDKTTYIFPGLITLDTLLLYAKTASKEKNWSLDSIAQEELKDSKIPYEFEIFEFYMRDVKKFIKYSAVDTLLLMRLEEVVKFLELFQLILNISKTEWNSYSYRSLYLTNLLKYELSKRKDGDFVMRNNLTPLNPKKAKQQGSSKEIQFQGAYNTDVGGTAATNGLYNCLFDLDFSAFYPSSAITTNICPDVLKFTVEDKDKHQDYLFMSKIGFGNKYLNLPSSTEIYDEI